MRRRFSESIGKTAPREAIQRETVDNRLASRLWSAIDLIFFRDMEDFVSHGGDTAMIWYQLFDDFLGEPIDEVEDFVPKNQRRLKNIYFSEDWAIKYDIAQFFGDFAKIQGVDHS